MTMRPRWLALAAVLALLPSWPAAGGDTPEVAEPRTIDGRIDDWTGESLMIGGTTVMSHGELVHQDHIYDDLGAFVASARNASGLGGQAYAVGMDPPRVTGNLRGNTEKAGVGTFVYPDDEARFGNNAADIMQFRASLSGDRVDFLVVFTTLLQPDTTVVGLALGGSGAEPHEWPLGAGIATPGTERVVTLWGTGGMVDDQPLEAVGGQLAVSLEDNAYEFSLPVSLVGTQFRAYLAAGLWDAEEQSWMAVQQTRTATDPGGSDGTVPNIFNVAFRTDEASVNGDTGVYASNSWWERAQAAALAAGDIGRYFADVDLTAEDTPEAGPLTGYHQRIHRSPSTVPPHEGVSWVGVPATNGMHSPAGRWTYHFLGPWQPYSIYVPPEPQRMTVLLHGSGNTMIGAWRPGIQRDLGDTHHAILVEPLARGVHNGYAEYAELAVFEAMDDAELHYDIDPSQTILTGGSMGGIGTYRLAALHPEEFAGAIAWAGCAGSPGPHCTSAEETLEVFANLRHVDVMVHQGTADPLIPFNHGERIAAELDRLGYAHRFYRFPAGGHTSFIEWDDYRLESAFIARQDPIEENPSRVTYRTSEGWWSPELSPDLVYDHAYWVSGLRVRDTTLGDGSFGRVDATTYGRGGTVFATSAVPPAYAQGPPNGHVVSGRDTDAPAPPLPRENRFTADLENLRAASFDLGRMGLHTADPLSATVVTDGPAELRLLGTGPVAVEGAEAVQDGDDVVVRLDAEGTHVLVIRSTVRATEEQEGSR